MGPVSEGEAVAVVVVVVSSRRGQWCSMLSALLATCQVISRAGPLETSICQHLLTCPRDYRKHHRALAVVVFPLALDHLPETHTHTRAHRPQCYIKQQFGALVRGSKFNFRCTCLLALNRVLLLFCCCCFLFCFFDWVRLS